MHLLEALGFGAADELDASRALRIGRLELGVEAAVEAARILAGGEFQRDVVVDVREFQNPVYWAIAHRTEGAAELFGFPAGAVRDLPTAIEVGLVRAIAAATPDLHPMILEGGSEIVIGPAPAWSDFRRIINVVARPMIGDSLLFGGATQAIIAEDVATLLSDVALNCLANSLRTSPLKFRFIELYRVMEARFLADIKAKVISGFDAEPNATLVEAIEALKSEMKQIMGLSETQQEAFEACWIALAGIKNVNRLTAALFRRIEKKDAGGGGKSKSGAALLYQLRCAIVHAGAKDMIFENFPDGEDALQTVLPSVERAALLLVGVELS